METQKLGFQKLGFYAHEIGFHFLWSVRAITLHVSGILEYIIKIIGKWQSDAFRIYIYGQIATFTQSVAAAMAKVRWFKHTTASDLSQF